MDWKTKNNPGEVDASLEELKICEFCGTLNYIRNTECFTCGWKGQFNQEPGKIEIAWRRLRNEFETVRLEHVTSWRAPILGDFGLAKKTSVWQRWKARLRNWCRDAFRHSATRRVKCRTKQTMTSQKDIIA